MVIFLNEHHFLSTPFTNTAQQTYPSTAKYHYHTLLIMFSANENIVLRQHKRRIIQFVEETI
jgi:hypothetical protein